MREELHEGIWRVSENNTLIRSTYQATEFHPFDSNISTNSLEYTVVLALLHEHLHPLEGHEYGLGGARHHRAAQLARRIPQTEAAPEGTPVLRVAAEHHRAAGKPEGESK